MEWRMIFVDNEYEIRGEDTVIFLDSPEHGRMETIISTSSLQKLMEFKNKWRPHYEKATNSFYAIGNQNLTKGKPSRFGLQRWVMGMPHNMEVDHINHDTLDNRLTNLRILTHSQNQQNRKGANRTSSSGVLGVHWHKSSQKWCVQLRVNGKKMLFGYYDDLKEAETISIQARARHMPFSKESVA